MAAPLSLPPANPATASEATPTARPPRAASRFAATRKSRRSARPAEFLGLSRGTYRTMISRLVRVQGLTIHTQVSGQGEPLLLHSGVFTGAQSWDPLLPE